MSRNNVLQASIEASLENLPIERRLELHQVMFEGMLQVDRQLVQREGDAEWVRRAKGFRSRLIKSLAFNGKRIVSHEVRNDPSMQRRVQDVADRMISERPEVRERRRAHKAFFENTNFLLEPDLDWESAPFPLRRVIELRANACAPGGGDS